MHNEKRRLAILEHLAHSSGASVSSIARASGLSWSGAKHHLARLEGEGVVASRFVQSRRVYRLAADPVPFEVSRLFACESAIQISNQILRAPLQTATEIANATRLSRRVVYHHVARLRRAGLVTATFEPMRLTGTQALRDARR